MTTELVQFRVDSKIKKQMVELSEREGMDLPTALRVFMYRAASAGFLPYMRRNDDIEEESRRIYSNPEFREAYDELEANRRGEVELKSYDDFADYLKERGFEV